MFVKNYTTEIRENEIESSKKLMEELAIQEKNGCHLTILKNNELIVEDFNFTKVADLINAGENGIKILSLLTTEIVSMEKHRFNYHKNSSIVAVEMNIKINL